MNKFAKTLCMMAVVVLAFTSCKKNDQDVKSFAFNGSFEQLQVETSNYNGRASIDDHMVSHFDDGDEVMIFKIDPDNPASSQATNYLITNGGNTWTLNGDPIDSSTEGTAGLYYAFYPAGNVKELNLSDENRATFNVAAEQRYRANNVPENAMYMAARDDTHKKLTDTYFMMKNIMGVLKVQLYSTQDRIVKNIYLVDRSINLVGDVSLKIDKVNPSILTTFFYNYDNSQAELAQYLNEIGYNTDYENKNDTIKLNCGDGVALSHSYFDPTVFYIVVRPLALRANSSIIVEFTNGGIVEYPSHYNNIIKPNVIRILEPIKVD